MNDFNILHKNVQAAAIGLGTECEVHNHKKFPREIRSPHDFAAALGYEIQRITKTLFLCGPEEQRYVAAVCSIDRRLDLKSIAEAIGVKRVEVSSLEDLKSKTGYPKNGVSPLGLTEDVSVIVDTKLLHYPTVLIGGGAAAIEIELTPSDLVRASRATVRYITAHPDPE
jgi:Cys-tRNA(Pro)/Cys-tRNA(Cys) deacylase